MSAYLLDTEHARRVRSAQETLRLLAAHQLSHWRSISKPLPLYDFERLNNEIPHISIFEIRDGLVKCWKKPTKLDKQLQFRSDAYQAFIQTVLNERRCAINTTLAYVLNDRHIFKETIPVFGYQKRNFDTTIMLPDIEFLQYDFYQDGIYADALPFQLKRAAGLFVGGTSGAGIISKRKVVERQVPRINSALFFRDKEDVDFFIAKIGQIDGEETKQAILDLDLAGRPMRWPDHYEYKFHLSMDGNGATCSRVVLSLKSNSVLIKYTSEWGLFFFPLLRAGEHFIEVRSDQDVLSLISLEKQHPGYWSHIAKSGQDFYRTYLTRERLIDYSSYVLKEYAECFGH